MKVIEKAFNLLSKLPTTQARVVVTLVIWFGTAIHVWKGGDIGFEFLGAIIAMSGLDVAHFHSKRKTAWTPEIQNGHNPIEDEEESEDERG